jgi:predicted ATPase/DNA-binding SARP family transcriptional activator
VVVALEFRVLGEIAVLRDGTPLDVGGRRPRALLALLIVQRGRPVPVEAILDRLWPNEPPDTAVKTIQVYVSRIRAALGEDRNRIVSRGSAYELVADPGMVDAAAFADEVATGRALLARGTHRDALAALDRALDRWRGRPFGELADEPFLRAETLRLEDLEADLRELRASALIALGRAGEAIGGLRQLLADQPARESAWSRLLFALYAAGRQADALEAFHQARKYLDEELGIEPGPELQAAHLAVLQQSADIPGPIAIGLDGDSARSPAGALVAARRGSALLGRDRDREAVEEAFTQGVRMVTLSGPGGIGKTTLWRYVLSHRPDRDPAPVVAVELEAVRGADLVPAAVAEAIGGTGDATEQLGDRAVLLGLDNLEHLIDAAPWISDLLAACPNVRILATSREPLRVRDEFVHAVGPLDAAASRELFLERARRVRPELPASDAIDAICDRLDRLPLAIELAAARTSLLSPKALLARLGGVLDVLGESPRHRADRQRTLRSTIAWSYDLLEPDLKRVFRWLSVFVGGFGVDAAEAVAGANLDDLEKLLSQSLLVARYDRDEPRFRQLEMIREFGLERLRAGDGVESDSGELNDAQSAHLGWASLLVRRAQERTTEAGSRELASELDNLRAAMAFASSIGDDVALWQIAVGLSDVWQTRGHLAEARQWLEPGLDRARISPELRLEALDDASTMAFRQGDLDASTHLAETELALARELARPRRAVAALAKLAQVALRAGDPERARGIHAEALAIAAQDDDRRPLLVSLSSQANADLLEGRADLAADAFDHCLEIARDVGRPESVATASFNVGLARLMEGRDLAAARSALHEALDRYEALEDSEGVGYVLVAVARLLVPTDPELAARALGASNTALASVGATLEAVEEHVRGVAEAHLRTILDEATFAAELAEGAGQSWDGWVLIARTSLQGA